MTDRKSLDDFIAELQRLFGGNTMAESIKPKLRALVSSFLAKQNIVTREEFDVQSAVLLRTRQRIEELENQLAELQTLVEQRPPQ